MKGYVHLHQRGGSSQKTDRELHSARRAQGNAQGSSVIQSGCDDWGVCVPFPPPSACNSLTHSLSMSRSAMVKNSSNANKKARNAHPFRWNLAAGTFSIPFAHGTFAISRGNVAAATANKQKKKEETKKRAMNDYRER